MPDFRKIGGPVGLSVSSPLAKKKMDAVTRPAHDDQESPRCEILLGLRKSKSPTDALRTLVEGTLQLRPIKISIIRSTIFLGFAETHPLSL